MDCVSITLIFLLKIVFPKIWGKILEKIPSFQEFEKSLSKKNINIFANFYSSRELKCCKCEQQLSLAG